MTNSSFENNIGIIGLGVLGSAIAKNFIDKNISISGYDINEKKYMPNWPQKLRLSKIDCMYEVS